MTDQFLDDHDVDMYHDVLDQDYLLIRRGTKEILARGKLAGFSISPKDATVGYLKVNLTGEGYHELHAHSGKECQLGSPAPLWKWRANPECEWKPPA